MESDNIRTTKLKKGLIPLIIFLMLILSIFYVPIVSAYVDITIENWDTYAVGVSSGSNSYLEWERVSGDDFLTTNANAVSEPNTLHLHYGDGSPDIGYINLTTDFEYIGRLSFLFYYTYSHGAGVNSITFRNSTGDVLAFRFEGSNINHEGKIQYRDVAGTYHNMVATVTDGSSASYEIRITHNSSNFMHYQLFKNNVIIFDDTDTSRYASTWTSFNQIYFDGNDDGDGRELWIDDINISLGTGEGEESGIEGYDSIGHTGCGNLHETNSIVLETRCEIEFYANIKAIDLQIGNLYIDNYDVTKGNLFLKLNGVPLGSASVLLPNIGGYVVRWTFDTAIHVYNEKILCEFYTNSYTWFVGWSYSDVDNDGDISYYNHNQINYYDGFYSKIGGVARDLCYKIWGNFEAISPSYDDAVYLSDSTVNIYEPVDVYATVSTKEYQNYLYIYDADFDLLETHIINGWTYHILYVPEKAETHYFNLTRNSIIEDSKTLTVTDKEYTYLIFTAPNPSRRNTPFEIKYIYNNTQYDGLLSVYTDEMEFIDSFFVPKSTSTLTNISFSFPLDGIYIMRLAVYINSTVYEVKYTHTHVIQSTTYENVLRASGDTINVNDQMTLFGTHNFLFGDVYVKISDDMLVYVGNANSFSFIYKPLTPKIYVCALILKVSDNAEVILDYANFTAIEWRDFPEEPTFVWGLPIEYVNAMFGAFFTLGFLIIPFALSKGKASNIIYAIFGGMGLGISTIMGLFPLWLPFMITVIIFAILIVEYKRKG